MKSICQVLTILVLANHWYFLNAASPSNDDETITIVREQLNQSGVPNRTEKMPWHPGLTVGIALQARGAQVGFHCICYLVSGKSIIHYSDRETRLDPTILDDLVHPGDILVFGGIDPERITELDKIPEIQHALGVTWNECKHRIRRMAGNQLSIPELPGK